MGQRRGPRAERNQPQQDRGWDRGGHGGAECREARGAQVRGGALVLGEDELLETRVSGFADPGHAEALHVAARAAPVDLAGVGLLGRVGDGHEPGCGALGKLDPGGVAVPDDQLVVVGPAQVVVPAPARLQQQPQPRPLDGPADPGDGGDGARHELAGGLGELRLGRAGPGEHALPEPGEGHLVGLRAGGHERLEAGEVDVEGLEGVDRGVAGGLARGEIEVGVRALKILQQPQERAAVSASVEEHGGPAADHVVVVPEARGGERIAALGAQRATVAPGLAAAAERDLDRRHARLAGAARRVVRIGD